MKRKIVAGAPNEVRLIGGQWRQTPLSVVSGVPGLRPTPGRVRQILFDWLQHIWLGEFTDRRVLDLFAGTGALGFEAASRGISHVVCVESDKRAAACLDALRQRLNATQLSVRRTDALSFLRQSSVRFDLIFADPPFHQDWASVLLPLLTAHLTPGGLVYFERELPAADDTTAAFAGWQVIRAGQAGQVRFYLLTPDTGDIPC